jgi:arginase family enzyme
VPDVVKACDGPVYLTFDCDGLDASLVPALGTPEPGGLGWYDTLTLVSALANGPGIIGLDVSEIAPIKGLVAPHFAAISPAVVQPVSKHCEDGTPSPRSYPDQQVLHGTWHLLTT